MNKIYQDLKALNISKILLDEPLYKHTSYRVGGPAMIYVEASSFHDLEQTINYALKNKIRYFVIGNGSNVLISDKEFAGIVIATKKLDSFEISGNQVYAMCGVNLINLAYKTAFASLSGLEFLSGIPGCVGGAIFMNAGAYKKDISMVVDEVLVYRNQKQEWLSKEELNFAYRASIMQEHRDWIVLAVRLTLEEQDKNEIIKLINERKERRQATQPYTAFSAGSVFKNPSPQVSSWSLIDEVGMRGFSINDAQVSIKHSNFIINNERASSKDIFDLITKVKEEVKKVKDVTLKVEIELINFDEN